jgi:hypothetical protein
MMTEGGKPKRWQFSLRWLLAATLVIGVGLGLFARWWTAPYAERIYFPNGALRYERSLRRDWRGRISLVKATAYYSTGQTAIEKAPGGYGKFWSPQGEPVSFHQADHYWHLDKGDGASREPEGP